MGKTSFHHGKSNWNVSSLVEFVYSGGTAVEVRIERAKLEDAELILEGQRKCF